MLMRNIPDIYINVDGNMVGPEMTFTHYLLHNINIDENMVDPQKIFIHLMSVKRVESKMQLCPNEVGSSND